jgi:hypothetical protein
MFIPDPDPDPYFSHPGSRIQGSIKQLFPDPDPQHQNQNILKGYHCYGTVTFWYGSADLDDGFRSGSWSFLKWLD